MATIAPERPAAAEPAPPPQPTPRRRLSRLEMVGLVILAWIALYIPFRGKNTLPLAPADLSKVSERLNDFNAWVGDHQTTSPVFVYFFNPIRRVIDTFTTAVQHLISQPYGSRPLPMIGWLGVVAIAGFVAWAWGNWKVSVLAVAGFVFMGLQGLWQESMDTLALTLVSVAVSLLVGIPIGVWSGLSRRAEAVVTPILDFMQIMPAYAYLTPLALFFLIGPASAVISTVIYAVPPVIRLTSHGIRGVPANTVEAADSLGSTEWQRLLKVLLPMARRTIVVGINQTIMAALSMVTISALIGAPGLGQAVIQALESLDVGTAGNAGLAIVVMAIILDRVTTAASVRADPHVRAAAAASPYRRYRRPALGVGALITLALAYVSYTYLFAAQFPGDAKDKHPVGDRLTSAITDATTWVQDNFSGVTSAIKNAITYHGLNPLQSLLDNSPFWLTGLALLGIALVVGGLRAVIWTAISLGVIIGVGLWQDSMDTLAATLVATVLTMVIGIVVGVWMGRSNLADQIIRPVLDMLQVIPAFVYLVPLLALFAPSRFTAIVAAIAYAAPVAVKIIADGIRQVSATTVEAATSAGSSTWQLITKVQLPMSARTLVLATNQGLIYVLSMVVVGGLVGAGALGYDVVAGFTQLSVFGKGLAAGLAIVMLGIMLDRVTRAAADRATNRHARRA
jgi:glycine betaine/proline transport system permease protein